MKPHVEKHDSPKMLTSIGPYQVEKLVGRGAMGDVYKAFDPQLKRHVAVKVLAPQLSQDDQFIQRFIAEAAAIAQLHHRNIVQIYFTGEDQGRHYFAMQFVDGPSLADVLKRVKTLPPERAVRIILQVLDGLAAAHEAGMVHRDIKPANILLAKTGQVLVADFGLVKSQGSGQTLNGVVLGTPDFLAPEQAAGRSVDARTDLYSVGVMLYRMLSGRNPFEAENPVGLLYQHLHETPAPLTSVCRVPQGLADVTHRLLNKLPEDRYQTAAEVHEQLSKLTAASSAVCEPAVNQPSMALDTQTAALPVKTLDMRSLDSAILNLREVWWQRLVPESARNLFRKLRSRVAHGEQTQQLSIDAIRICEDRCTELGHLVKQSKQVCSELEQLGKQNQEAATAARQRRVQSSAANVVQQAMAEEAACEYNAEDLRRQLEDQIQQTTVVQNQYVEAKATLESLKNQQDVLLARLSVARGQIRMMGGDSGAKSGLRRWAPWALVLAFMLILAVVVTSRGPETPATSVTAATNDSEHKAETKGEMPSASSDAVPVLYDNGSRMRNSIGMEFIRVPAGEFMMGSPNSEIGRDPDEQQHLVRITQPFFIGIHEVTIGQFKRFVTATGYKTNAETDGKGGWGEYPGVGGGYDKQFTWRYTGYEQTDDHPVGNVTWYDANAFVRWLSGKENVLYRLPTEAEAEYACRGGTTTSFQTGTNASEVVRLANVLDLTFRDVVSTKYGGDVSKMENTPGKDGYLYTAPVGSFPPNPFGLHDMVGNVDEWCSDWFDHDYFKRSPVNDPVGPETGVFRSFRGGFWGSIVRHTRSANRSRFEPDYRANHIGFRIIRSVTPHTDVVVHMEPQPDSHPAATSLTTDERPDVSVEVPQAAEPTKLAGSPLQTVVRLPAPIDDVVVGGGGKFLLLHLQKLQQLVVFDVSRAKVLKYIPLASNNISYTAGAAAFFIGQKDEQTIQRWNLQSLELELTVDAPIGGVGKLAMGSQSDGPLFLLAERNAKKSWLINPVNMKAEPIVWEGWKGGAWGPVHINISHDGSSVVVCGGGWAGMELARIGDGRIQSRKTGGLSLDEALIAGNGTLVFPGDGPILREDLTTPIPEMEGVPFPAVDESLSVLFVIRDGKAILNVYGNSDARRRFSIRDIPELNQKTSLPIHKRVFLIPKASVLITIGQGSDELILRPFDLKQTLESEDVDYLFVNSDPQRTGTRGQPYTYAIEVLSRKGSVTFELESGPLGMTLSQGGVLNWTIPTDFKPGEVTIIVKIRDISQQEIFHSYNLQIQ